MRYNALSDTISSLHIHQRLKHHSLFCHLFGRSLGKIRRQTHFHHLSPWGEGRPLQQQHELDKKRIKMKPNNDNTKHDDDDDDDDDDDEYELKLWQSPPQQNQHVHFLGITSALLSIARQIASYACVEQSLNMIGPNKDRLNQVQVINWATKKTPPYFPLYWLFNKGPYTVMVCNPM